MMLDKNSTFLDELVEFHVSGQLKVAPEHASNKVLDYMGKPHIEVYEEFEKKFYASTRKCGKEQYLVPYLMSSHPGCTLNEAVELALFLKKHNIRPEQVQDFYPTPGTISTAMFYTGLEPYSMEPVFVPRTPEEKAMQRALLQYFMPKNKPLVEKALIMAKRRDLIGYGKECLITPSEKTAKQSAPAQRKTDNRHGTKDSSERRGGVGKRSEKTRGKPSSGRKG